MKKQNWFKKITLLFILIMFVNLLLAGSSFAYWAGNVTLPSNITNNINVNTGQGITENLTMNVTHNWYGPQYDDYILVPKGTYHYSFDQDISKEEIFDDYEVVFVQNGTDVMSTNLVINITNCTFTLFNPGMSNPPAINNYNQYIKCKVEFGESSATTDPNSFVPDETLTQIITGGTTGVLSFPMTSGVANKKIVRFTRYIENAPTTDSGFTDTLAASNLNLDFQLSLQDPNSISGPVWKQYNVTTSINDKNQLNGLGLYTLGHDSYTAPSYYGSTGHDGYHTIVVNNPDLGNEYNGKVYYVAHFRTIGATSYNTTIDITQPNTSAGEPMTFSESTSEYRWFHHYTQGDLVTYDGAVYRWHYGLPHNPNSREALPTNTSYWTKVEDITATTPNYLYRYQMYNKGDVVYNHNDGQYYVANKNNNFLAYMNHALTIRYWQPDDNDLTARNWMRGKWVSISSFLSNSVQYNLNNSYNEGSLVQFSDGNYYVATRNVPAQFSPQTRPSLWKRVVLP